mgnify:CR=1 FL=1
MTEFVPSTQIQDEVLDFLLTASTLQQIIAFHASDEAQNRLRYLLDANRDGVLTGAEHAELDEAEHLNHMMIILKAKAQKIQQ